MALDGAPRVPEGRRPEVRPEAARAALVQVPGGLVVSKLATICYNLFYYYVSVDEP